MSPTLKYPRSVRRRQVSAGHLIGLTLAALAASLLSGWMALQDPAEIDQQALAVHPAVELGAHDTEGWREAWAPLGDKTRLLVEPGADSRWVCPHIAGRERQPLCRRFASDLLGVCNQGNEYQLVLANGDIHHVDHALLGTHGAFTPVYHPDQPLSLKVAWIPSASCYPEVGLAEILAVDQFSNLLRFDGKRWRRIDELHSLGDGFGLNQ